MNIVAIRKEIEDYVFSRNELNEKISSINSENYQGAALEAYHSDLVNWQNDLAYLNRRIHELRTQINEIENEEN